MFSNLFKIIKKFKRSFYLQNKNASLIEHNLKNYSKINNDQELEVEKNKHTIILDNFLKKYNSVIENNLKQKLLSNHLIIDIGAGSLIHTNYFCENYSNIVYSIEPSKEAVDIGKKIYSNLKNNIIINDFAEDALKNLPLQQKCFFYTGHVLSHLTEKSTIKILKFINNSPKGSFLLFDEIWSYKSMVKNKLFYVRNKEFWINHLSNFDIDFYEFEGKAHDVLFYKGFFGKKLR